MAYLERLPARSAIGLPQKLKKRQHPALMLKLLANTENRICRGPDSVSNIPSEGDSSMGTRDIVVVSRLFLSRFRCECITLLIQFHVRRWENVCTERE